MGTLDELIKVAGGALSGKQQQNNLMETIFSLINNPQSGGLSGLVQIFQSKGLTDTISSWISTGKNLPISADQIQQVLGDGSIQKMAGNVGMPKEDLSNSLATLLPQIIDQLTPDGKLPKGEMMDQALNLLKRKYLGG
jgi:uncharacterized protein YidB (DUF937 family)